MRALALALLLAGCAAFKPGAEQCLGSSEELEVLAERLDREVRGRQRAEAGERAARRREDALRRQIEALRASERSMIEREERLGNRQR